VSGAGISYTYDLGWNMTQRAGQAYSVNDRNQITGGEGYSYSHDTAGNRTVLSTSGGGYVSYTYDDENQLIRMETDTSVTLAAYRWRTEFVYDGLRRLRSRAEFVWTGSGWYPNTTTLYVYDGRRVVQERNSANGPTVSYVRGLDLSGTTEGAGGIGGLLARSSGYQTATGSWTSHAFYHADGGGNVTFLSPSTYSGTMTRYSYDAYGRTTSLDGPLATANVYRFSSKELHAASGHYYYGYRFYDPQAQRWINRDPLGEAGGMNLYGFVGNGPVGAVDPLGLEWSDSWPNYLGPEPGAVPKVRRPANPQEPTFHSLALNSSDTHEASEQMHMLASLNPVVCAANGAYTAVTGRDAMDPSVEVGTVERVEAGASGLVEVAGHGSRIAAAALPLIFLKSSSGLVC
jgi:RHS repeat-associated protein